MELYHCEIVSENEILHVIEMLHVVQILQRLTTKMKLVQSLSIYDSGLKRLIIYIINLRVNSHGQGQILPFNKLYYIQYFLTKYLDTLYYEIIMHLTTI